MNQSEQINELMTALSKAQGTIKPALKNKKNPHFKSLYADLDSIWEACRDSLSQNGLAVVQTMLSNEHGMVLVTTLGHSSGQWMRSEMPIIVQKQDPQGIGSALTYYRRYTLACMVGVAPGEDLDAEEKSHSEPEQVISKKQIDIILGLTNGDSNLMNKILDHNGINRIEDLTVDNFERVFKWLHAVKAKAAQ